MLAKVSATKKKLILASGSRIRRQLLEEAGLEFEVINSNVDEDSLKKQLHGRPFGEQVKRLASVEAESISAAVLNTRKSGGLAEMMLKAKGK